MIHPTPADIGRRVIYRPAIPLPGAPPDEVGVITSFNDGYVFVRYGEDEWATPQATARENLTWAP